MIEQKIITANATTQQGAFPKFDNAGWPNAYPLWKGAVSVGTYTVPANKKASLRGILLGGFHANSNQAQAYNPFPLGWCYFRVGGSNYAEFRVQWSASDWPYSPLGREANLGISERAFRGMMGAMNFTSGQVLSILVSPQAYGGLTPQVCWLASFVMKDTTTGVTIIEKARTITTTTVSLQTIITYTVPANGVILKAILLQGTTIDYHLGIASLCYNGMEILEFPLIGRGDGATRFIPVQLAFLNGLDFQQGDHFEMLIDPPNTCGQKYEMVVFGTETDLGGGGGEYSFGNP